MLMNHETNLSHLPASELIAIAEKWLEQLEYSKGNYWPLRTVLGDTTAVCVFRELIERVKGKGLKEYPTIYHQIIERFGRDVQINKIQEEALELALAINHLQCPTKDDTEANLYGELADMVIMMEQAKILFDIERIQSTMRLKLNRFKDKYLSDVVENG